MAFQYSLHDMPDIRLESKGKYPEQQSSFVEESQIRMMNWKQSREVQPVPLSRSLPQLVDHLVQWSNRSIRMFIGGRSCQNPLPYNLLHSQSRLDH